MSSFVSAVNPDMLNSVPSSVVGLQVVNLVLPETFRVSSEFLAALLTPIDSRDGQFLKLRDFIDASFSDRPKTFEICSVSVDTFEVRKFR